MREKHLPASLLVMTRMEIFSKTVSLLVKLAKGVFIKLLERVKVIESLYNSLGALNVFCEVDIALTVGLFP